MAARFAAAFVLALALQVATAAPSCGCGLPVPLPTPIVGCGGAPFVDYGLPAYGASPVEIFSAPAFAAPAYGAHSFAAPAIDLVGAAPSFIGASAPLAFSAPAPLAFSAPALSAPAAVSVSAPTVVSSSAPVPVGPAQVVSKVAGPATSFVTPPACRPAAFELPVQSASSASVGPVSVSSDIVDGCCSTSCAATRAKCSGTTKKVSFKTPVIIDKGSSTSSSVAIVGAPVASRSTKAGTPQVSTAVYPAAAPATLAPAYYGGAPAYYGGASGYYGGASGYYGAPVVSDVVLPGGYCGAPALDLPYYGGVELIGAPAAYPAHIPSCSCTCA